MWYTGEGWGLCMWSACTCPASLCVYVAKTLSQRQIAPQEAVYVYACVIHLMLVCTVNSVQDSHTHVRWRINRWCVNETTYDFGVFRAWLPAEKKGTAWAACSLLHMRFRYQITTSVNLLCFTSWAIVW